MDFEEKIEGLWTGYFMNTKKKKKKKQNQSEIILVASKTSGSQFFAF